MEQSRPWPVLTLSGAIPSGIAWTVTCAFGVLTIGLVGLALLYGEILRRDLGATKVQAALQQDDFVALEEIRLQLATHPRWLDVFASDVITKVQGRQPLSTRWTTFQELALDLAYALSVSRLTTAERLADRLQGLADASQSRIAESLSNAVRTLRELNEELRTVESKNRELEGRLTAALQQFNLLRKDAGDLLGLDPGTEITKLEEIKLYSQGALAGVPTFDRLPDNILSLVELRDLLGSLGGSVREKDFEQFNAALKRITDASRALETSSRDLAVELLKSMTALHEKQDLLKRKTKATRDLVLNWLLTGGAPSDFSESL
jgi:hypothetical protein